MEEFGVDRHNTYDFGISVERIKSLYTIGNSGANSGTFFCGIVVPLVALARSERRVSTPWKSSMLRSRLIADL